MSIATLPAETPVHEEMKLYRLSVDQYHEMIRRGILRSSDPVELLEGWLVQKMPKNPRHVAVVELIADRLRALMPAGWYVRTENPITTDTSEPEPDISVPRGGPRDYCDRHPAPRETAIIIEVADSSLARDRGIKQRIYARAKVPLYWIVDIAERRVEVRTEPSGMSPKPAYGASQTFSGDEAVPVVIDGRDVGRIALRDILP